MRVADFDFDLPEDRIALHPAPRGTARLLHVPAGGFYDRGVGDLPDLLRPGDVLVVNDTKVMPAQLYGVRSREDGPADRPRTAVSATLIKRLDQCRWMALAKPGKRMRPGDRLHFGAEGRGCDAGALNAMVETKGEDGEITLAFDLVGPELDRAIALIGEMPLPPYISGRRPPSEADRRDYQTIYARTEGAVAAPTAGLHFTDDMFSRLEARGIGCIAATLHVGAGTFLPVKAEDTRDHKMHAEWGEIPVGRAAAINAAKAKGGRIVAVGTTSLRLLESAADHAGRIQPFEGETSIFITPGCRFRTADLLLTNFHLPRSTLFMLVCAFAGMDRMKAAYAHAIENGYRFYSYGDACLLERAP